MFIFPTNFQGEYTIRTITNDNPEFLTYLEKESLVPGTSFNLLEKAPFQGPLKLLLSGMNAPHYIGLEAAKNIFVSGDRPGVNPKRRAARGPDRALFSFSKLPISESVNLERKVTEAHPVIRKKKRLGRRAS